MWLLEFLTWFFVDLIWWRLSYEVGRRVLALVSFGKIQAGPYDSFGYNWLGCKRDLTGRLEIESTLVSGVGMTTSFFALAVILYFIA
ncbi:hypothetical protein [Bradyrhizobium sp. SEMIA]|uniref:hypothetical protein n=1 Tax=Bradyrhizobium sp. SEMIA TaxID=2597515 RepID=UPI0018A5A0BF|nr:hypothetical protein [Bradyrhizobium sp. SEMIA]QOG18592.1 hypothetical protein FOM02_15850 [Bradyrhizobium sp. SEMIA]